MKDNFDPEAGPQRKRNDNSQRDDFARANNGSRAPAHQHPNGKASGDIDFWVITDLLVHRWAWLLFGGLIFGCGFYMLGSRLVKPKFTASGQLQRYESPAAKDFFQSTPMSAETFAALIQSPDLLRRVGTNVNPAIPPEKLVKRIKVDPEADSDIVKVALAAGDAKSAVDLLNAYLREVVAFTGESQAQQAETVANNYFKKQLEKMNEDVASVQKTLRGGPASPQLTNKLNEVSTNLSALNNTLADPGHASALASFQSERLNKALVELTELASKYTDLNPQVQQKKSEIADLQKQINAAGTSANPPYASAGGLSGRSLTGTFNPELDIIRTKLLSLEEAKVALANKLREAQLFAADPPGMVKILASPSLETVQTSWRRAKLGIAGVLGGVVGIGVSLLLIMLIELVDKRLRTAADVERVTGLQVLSALGNLNQMPVEDRSQWAFRAWTMLQGRLSRSANHGLVCGITSSAEGEGRSTWIKLLAEAASHTGFRVLTIATKASPTHMQLGDEGVDPLRLQEQVINAAGENNGNVFHEGPSDNSHADQSNALISNVLASPAEVTEQLTGPKSQPVVHIPLPGWVWSLDRRKQWRDALNHWRRIDNLVILVELPPASVAEAVLLGANLPNLLWLADSGTADAAETRAQLETLRHARCNLVGAVLNRESAPSVKKRFPRWLGAFAVIAPLIFNSASAETNPNATAPILVPAVTTTSAEGLSIAASTNRSFSIVSPAQRAAWQQHLTLGPGDVITLALYGQPETARAEVAIGPDGRINFLEAQEVMASGFTIDELRAKLDEALAQYRRAPRTMITPIAFKSKKYYMLGKVTTKGVYTLDRPLTVLEAIARAHGLENGLVDRNIVDLADFQRSFLMRGGKRIALNFEKLFQEGDLAQNIAIEPGDYLYFPSTNVKEVYVVGEVRLPGTVTYLPDTTIIAAISARGGYTDRAYKARVLVVRGSINNPEAYAVDTHAILDGQTPDFKLRPKDIIYVNSRPFIRVEELTELAATAFIQSLITTWTGIHVVKPQ